MSINVRTWFTAALLYFTLHAQSALVDDVTTKFRFEARHHLVLLIGLTPFWWAAFAGAIVSGDVCAPPNVCMWYLVGIASI